MIDPPAVEVEITPAAQFHVQWRRLPSVRGSSPSWPPRPGSFRHCRPARSPFARRAITSGLGVGTQLGLAVAAGLRRWLQLPELPIEALAAAVGRGKRSAVGTYGFQQGGLIVDAGSRVGTAHHSAGFDARSSDIRQCPPCASQTPAEHPQRVAIRSCSPGKPARPGGRHRNRRICTLPPVPERVTRELWRITEEEMLPAVERADCDAFGDAVYRFGRLAGECFAAVQGGPFASAEIARLVDAIRDHGVPGVGQSSWGPTVFAVCAFPSRSGSR